MSLHAIAWAADQHPELPGQKLLLLALANHWNWKTSQCNPSVARLVEWTGLNPATIARYLNSLEHDQGLIIRHKRRSKGGAQLSTQYELVGVAAPLAQEESADSPQATHIEETPIPETSSVSLRSTDADASEAGEIKEFDENSTDPPDPLKAIFRVGVDYLVRRGQSPASARKLIGKWKQTSSPDQILSALNAAIEANAVDPIPYVTKILNTDARLEAVKASYDADWKRQQAQKYLKTIREREKAVEAGCRLIDGWVAPFVVEFGDLPLDEVRRIAGMECPQ